MKGLSAEQMEGVASLLDALWTDPWSGG
jgi:hypothetical protein